MKLTSFDVLMFFC